MVSVLTTLGVGSGIDSTTLIDALVKAQQDPRAAALTTRSTTNDARISGVAQVNSGMSGLIAALSARTAGGALGPLPASSDPTIVAASATSGATPRLDPVDLQINALAAGQTLVSGTVASPTAAVGLGTMTLTLGTRTSDGGGGFGFAGGSAAPITVTIGPGNNSLTGLRDAINAAQKGSAAPIVASVIADASGGRLVLKGPAGAASAFIVTADPETGSDGSSDTGLTRFVHMPATSAMTVAATAHDASVTIDGVTVTRPGNHFADLIDGVTLDLRKASPGTSVTIAATRDADGLKSAVRDLVGALNAVGATATSLVHAATAADPAGVLSGDATMRRFRQQLTALTSRIVGNATSRPTRLADLGITTARDGTLSVDDTRLGAAVAAAPDAVEKLLAGLTAGGATKGALTALADDFAAATKTSDPSNRYARETTAIATEKATLDARMTTYRATLVQQYAAMDAAVAASKSTQSFLDQQIKAWNQTTN